MKLAQHLIVAMIAFGFAFTVTVAHAATIVSPNADASTEGNLANTFPFSIGTTGVSSQRYQQVYASTEFSALAGPVFITQLAFRPDHTVGAAFSATLSNIQIDLSTTSAAPDALSSTFAANVGADDVTVHTGSLSLSSSDTGPAAGPKAFDITIPLSTPFLYDPSLGNLLLDVRNFGGGTTTSFDADFSADGVSRAVSANTGSVNDTAAGMMDTTGLVTQFTTTPAPEPASVALLTLGAAGLFARRNRRPPALTT